ncbi:hypothetical protein [Kribbella catacumbae]|uniref:hypothetical protein n=1 Tax=Kribbella catacumbae TaxID=460086 RepID=UPI000380C739|nr:hypothetical protein [Kribbella catacumbae]
MFEDEAALDAALATPSSGLVADLARLEGDLVLLGAGGKMGPSRYVRCARSAVADQLGRRGAGRRKLSVRDLALEAGKRLDVEPELTGMEAPTALLNDASRCHELFGRPDAGIETLLDWQAHWILRGGVLSGKPTKFQVRDGKF